MTSYQEHIQNTDELRLAAAGNRLEKSGVARILTSLTAVDQWQDQLTACVTGGHFDNDLSKQLIQDLLLTNKIL